MSSELPTLRPLRMGEILDRAIRLYRRNFLQFLGIIAVVQVPLSLVQMLASMLMVAGTFSRLEQVLSNPAAAPEGPIEAFSQLIGPGYAAGASLNGLVTVLSFVLVQGLATAALTLVVAQYYVGDPSPGVLNAFRQIKDVWFSLLGALLLAVFIFIMLLFWWILVPCVGWVSGLGLTAFLWLVIVPLLAPVIILERQPATVAWRRAWNLARRRFWWVFMFGLVLYALNLLIVAGPAALLGSLGPLLGGDALTDGSFFTIQTLVQSLTTLVTGLLYLPLQVAAMTILYLDLRVRTEGVDLLLRASGRAGRGERSSVGPLPEPRTRESNTTNRDLLPALAATAPAPTKETLMTGPELGYFSLVTLGLGALLVVIYAVLVGLVLAAGAALGGV